MTVREATAADHPAVLALFEAMDWDRPWPRPPVGPDHLEGKLVLVAEEDGEVVGFVFGEPAHHGRAHVNVACIRPESRRQGVMTALLKEFAARARAAGSEHITLDVDTSNEVGRAVWQRLGFREFSERLFAPIDALEARLSAPAGESRATVYVQTDDADAVEAATAKVLPRPTSCRPRRSCCSKSPGYWVSRASLPTCRRSTPQSAARTPRERGSRSPRRASPTRRWRSTSTTGRPGSTRRTRSAACPCMRR